MKPLYFRIKNYKSIKDTQNCYFEDGYTILAGKNESGKSTILEALRDFDEREKISEDSIPFTNPDAITEITVAFSVSKEEINEVNKDKYLLKGVTKQNTILITKTRGSDEYTYSCEFELIKMVDFDEYCQNNVPPVLEKLKLIAPKFAQELQGVEFDNLKSHIEENFSEAEKKVRLKTGLVSVQENHIKLINEINDILTSYTEAQNYTKKVLKELSEKNMPYFVYYSSFDDFFPDSLTFDEIEENEYARDLEKISNFRINEIINGSPQSKKNHQSKINSEFSDLFKTYWTQDDIKLEVQADGEKVNFWIEENDYSFTPSQRSQGQKWFLSFYVKVVSKMQESIPNVILIDEPGLFLHAKAQKDLLNTLENKFDKNVIVFSTHSPYLIEENKLDNIRLVEKIENETKIHHKTWANIEDKESLTPILTAIGLGAGDAINDRVKHNIICEGVEDVIYLRAFNSLLEIPKEINFINGNGVDKIHYLGRILEGWGCKIKFLIDNDQAGKDAKKSKLSTMFGDDAIVFACESKGCTIDLLTNNDFKKYVLEDTDADVTINSEYIKKMKKNKPGLARNFSKNIKEAELDKESIENIRNLFDRIS